MATWQDGPAYAPRERPLGFAQPATGLPLTPAPTAPATPVPPDQIPTTFEPPSEPLTPLDQLARPPRDDRDPSRPFDVVAATLTATSAWSGSAWGSVHQSVPGAPASPLQVAWTADQPWQSPYAPPTAGAFPAPGTPQWFGANPYAAPTPPPPPVTFRGVLEAATAAYLVPLGLGLLFASFSPFCLVLALFMASLTHHRHRLMRWLVAAAMVLALLLYGFGQLAGVDIALSRAAQLGCFVAGFGGLIVQYLALRAGERPERQN